MKSAVERIAVIGLGYVGLPVAVALAERFEQVIGFDVAHKRVEALRAGHDWTGEIDGSRLAASTLKITCDAVNLTGCSFFIVTVPTPIDSDNSPDLSPIIKACAMLGPQLSPGAVIVFESTVYPGVTDDICAPLLEEHSGLTRGKDFFLGYSPERINPGDREHRLDSITKVIAAEDAATLQRLRQVYGAIVSAGLHEAPSIKVAEAAKVIENTQRDLNIALMNELALIFDKMDLSTRDVLEAAGTKWNFLPFSPGLVAGHCIGVDPYYLTHASEKAGYDPEVILAGRRVNSNMSAFVAEKALSMTRGRNVPRIGVLGLTFKANVPDLRNSKVPEVVKILEENGAEVLVHDPRANVVEAQQEYSIDMVASDALVDLDALLISVAHEEFSGWAESFSARLKDDAAILDICSLLKVDMVPPPFRYWSL